MKYIIGIFSHMPSAIPSNYPDFGICSKKLIFNQKKMKQGHRLEFSLDANEETTSSPHRWRRAGDSLGFVLQRHD